LITKSQIKEESYRIKDQKKINIEGSLNLKEKQACNANIKEKKLQDKSKKEL
jgi:hypothetical protein